MKYLGKNLEELVAVHEWEELKWKDSVFCNLGRSDAFGEYGGAVSFDSDVYYFQNVRSSSMILHALTELNLI